MKAGGGGVESSGLRVSDVAFGSVERSSRRSGVIARVVMMLGLAGSACVGEAATAYEAVVGPIFRARCAGCHGAEKQKGKLALHTWERVVQGGDSGPLWVAGKPDESELVRRLKLPNDDEEHMPPADEPQLSAEEMALLVRWIERGASEKVLVEELKLEPALARAVAELPKKLAEVEQAAGPSAEVAHAVDASTVERNRAPLAAKVAQLQRRFPGALSYESRSSATLRFTAAGLGRDFGDTELAELAAVGDAVDLLDISGTAVTEKAAEVLGRFPNVRVLRMGFTAVGDAVARAIGRLERVEVVVLTETGVTEGGWAEVAKAKGLKKFHVGVARAEEARRAGLPVVEIGMPAPAAEEGK